MKDRCFLLEDSKDGDEQQDQANAEKHGTNRAIGHETTERLEGPKCLLF